jgi:hypothetical protein
MTDGQTNKVVDVSSGHVAFKHSKETGKDPPASNSTEKRSFSLDGPKAVQAPILLSHMSAVHTLTLSTESHFNIRPSSGLSLMFPTHIVHAFNIPPRVLYVCRTHANFHSVILTPLYGRVEL